MTDVRHRDRSQVERGYYLSSTGPKFIPEMNVHNLKAALAKVERDEPYRLNEIADMREEVARRDEEYAREHPEGTAE